MKLLQHILQVFTTIMFLAACSASNCPLESVVTCNYGFYDSEGTPIQYGDVITISTLLPGFKTVYSYKKLGYSTIELNEPDQSLIDDGYTESVSVQRKDTVLINKLSNASSMSVPMSYYADVDTLILTYESISNKDTIKVYHHPYTHIDLPECGPSQFHKLGDIKYTEFGIFKIEVCNKNVNYDGRENIKLYFNGVAE